jgi:hypothetical protein
VAFAAVLVEPSLRSDTPNHIGGAAIIEVVIGAATVRVSRGIDAATLTTVLLDRKVDDLIQSAGFYITAI